MGGNKQLIIKNMEFVTEETIRNTFKPYDIVTDKSGNVGFIQEVGIIDTQPDPYWQISYCVNWLVGNETKVAWFRHEELTKHCSLFVKIAESSCHPLGGNKDKVSLIMNLQPLNP